MWFEVRAFRTTAKTVESCLPAYDDAQPSMHTSLKSEAAYKLADKLQADSTGRADDSIRRHSRSCSVPDEGAASLAAASWTYAHLYSAGYTAHTRNHVAGGGLLSGTVGPPVGRRRCGIAPIGECTTAQRTPTANVRSTQIGGSYCVLFDSAGRCTMITTCILSM